ncbi:MAG: nucleotide exchange factor GrpE, partial [Pseudomonadota bacterium]
MSSDTYQPNDGQAEKQPEKPDEPASPTPADAPLGLEREAALKAEIAELNDRALRLAAEVENTRRRGEREKADASRYAITSFARELLAVADNLERALQSAPVEAGINAEAVSSFVTGVRMTERALA